MKILNLYAGIGGNRKLWGDDHEITAVENDQAIADVYKLYFPDDNMIVTDAHKYLLNYYKEYDFIWSSPPCPSHSDIRRCGVHKGQVDAIYPEMSLYQQIILLQNFATKEQKWVVENVIPYYKPLIPERKKLHRHLYWSNFPIGNFDVTNDRKHTKIIGSQELYGFSLSNSKVKNKRKVLRNMVDPELGRFILDCAENIIRKPNPEQTEMSFK